MKRQKAIFRRIIFAFSCTFLCAQMVHAQLPDWAQEFDLVDDQSLRGEDKKEQEEVKGDQTESSDSVPQSNSPDDQNIDDKSAESVEDLKQQMLELNRDLLILEEELLFPASTQISVFLSLDVGTFFQLDSVRLEIDGKQVATHLYTERQLHALHRGGVQRLHIGNIKSGAHEVAAFFIGKGTHERDYKRAASVEVEKAEDPLMLELVISDSSQKLQPEFKFETWIL